MLQRFDGLGCGGLQLNTSLPIRKGSISIFEKYVFDRNLPQPDLENTPACACFSTNKSISKFLIGV